MWTEMAGPKQAGGWEVLEQREVSTDLLGTPRWRPVTVFTWIGVLFSYCFRLVLGFFWRTLPCILSTMFAGQYCCCGNLSSHLQIPVAVCLHAAASFVLKIWLWVCMCSCGYGEDFISYLKKEVISAEEMELLMDGLSCHWCTLEMQVCNPSPPTPPFLCPSLFFASFISKSR